MQGSGESVSCNEGISVLIDAASKLEKVPRNGVYSMKPRYGQRKRRLANALISLHHEGLVHLRMGVFEEFGTGAFAARGLLARGPDKYITEFWVEGKNYPRVSQVLNSVAPSVRGRIGGRKMVVFNENVMEFLRYHNFKRIWSEHLQSYHFVSIAKPGAKRQHLPQGTISTIFAGIVFWTIMGIRSYKKKRIAKDKMPLSSTSGMRSRME
eukprot:2519913-Rhodomonas_salina.1